MTASAAKRMCSGKRSTSRPTVICAMAPHRNTAVVRPPTASSEISLPTRSSTIFGSETEIVLNTKPALNATMTKRANSVTAIGNGSDTSAVVENEPRIDQAGGDADHARHQKCAAPGECRRQHCRDAGGERDAEIAANTV